MPKRIVQINHKSYFSKFFFSYFFPVKIKHTLDNRITIVFTAPMKTIFGGILGELTSLIFKTKKLEIKVPNNIVIDAKANNRPMVAKCLSFDEVV